MFLRAALAAIIATVSVSLPWQTRFKGWALRQPLPCSASALRAACGRERRRNSRFQDQAGNGDFALTLSDSLREPLLGRALANSAGRKSAASSSLMSQVSLNRKLPLLGRNALAAHRRDFTPPLWRHRGKATLGLRPVRLVVAHSKHSTPVAFADALITLGLISSDFRWASGNSKLDHI